MSHRSRGRLLHQVGNGNGKSAPPAAERIPNKVAICIPSGGLWDAGFGIDYGSMLVWTTQNLVAAGLEVVIHMQISSYIHSNRQDVARLAMQDPAVTHLFWLDTDMRFPRDVLYRLLRHRVAFVGANYSYRKAPPQPVAMKRNIDTERAYHLMTTKDSTGLEPVEAIGFGCVLVAREVFEATKFPWFECWWDHDRHRSIGEDVHFSWLAQEAGYPVFVDHDVSKEILHAGQLEYSLAHTNDWDAMRLEQKAAREATKPQLVASA